MIDLRKICFFIIDLRKICFPFLSILPFTAPPRQSHSVVTRGWFLAYYEQTEIQGSCIDLPVFWILRTKIGKKWVVVTLLLKKTRFLQWCSRQRQVFLMTYPIETSSMKTKNKRTRSCRIRHWVFMAPYRRQLTNQLYGRLTAIICFFFPFSTLITV